ncbi:glycosyltransferase family 25 protein [Oricola sp.]|uniref:glycosyltransferase family 25 protein n=1 Tax=Oricola sp. TaxID=1979950 RepID=UPI003BA941FE
MLRMVINLDRAPERLEWTEKVFGDMQLDFRRVPAVEGKYLTGEEIARWSRRTRKGETLSGVEVGCFLSHRECWKTAVESGEEWVAIFEDDMHFAPDAADFIRAPSWIPDGISLVKLETYLVPVRLEARATPVGSYSVSRILSRHWGSGGYVVSRAAAAKLLEDSQIFSEVLDNFLFNSHHLPDALICHQLVPAVCIQDANLNKGSIAMPSAIEASRQAVRPPKPKGLAKLYREVARPFEQLTDRLARTGHWIKTGEPTRIVPYSGQSLRSD